MTRYSTPLGRVRSSLVGRPVLCLPAAPVRAEGPLGTLAVEAARRMIAAIGRALAPSNGAPARGAGVIAAITGGAADYGTVRLVTVGGGGAGTLSGYASWWCAFASTAAIAARAQFSATAAAVLAAVGSDATFGGSPAPAAGTNARRSVRRGRPGAQPRNHEHGDALHHSTSRCCDRDRFGQRVEVGATHGHPYPKAGAQWTCEDWRGSAPYDRT